MKPRPGYQPEPPNRLPDVSAPPPPPGRAMSVPPEAFYKTLNLSLLDIFKNVAAQVEREMGYSGLTGTMYEEWALAVLVTFLDRVGMLAPLNDAATKALQVMLEQVMNAHGGDE